MIYIYSVYYVIYRDILWYIYIDTVIYRDNVISILYCNIYIYVYYVIYIWKYIVLNTMDKVTFPCFHCDQLVWFARKHGSQCNPYSLYMPSKCDLWFCRHEKYVSQTPFCHLSVAKKTFRFEEVFSVLMAYELTFTGAINLWPPVYIYMYYVLCSIYLYYDIYIYICLCAYMYGYIYINIHVSALANLPLLRRFSQQHPTHPRAW